MDATVKEKPQPSTDSHSVSHVVAPNSILPSPYLNTKHQMFCQIVGILPYQNEQPMAQSGQNMFLRNSKNSKPSGLYPRVVRAYRYHTVQYWFVATLSNGLLWIQLVLGATLAALGGSSIASSRSTSVDLATGVTVLSAIQTVIGGLIIYFKSRNQPNRARQFRNNLRDVRTAIENAEAMFRDPACTWDATAKVKSLAAMYDAAVKTAEANYPDLWVGAQPAPPAVASPTINSGIAPDGISKTEAATKPSTV